MTGIASFVYIFAQARLLFAIYQTSLMLKRMSSELCILTFIVLPCPFFLFFLAYKELLDKSYFIVCVNVTNSVDRA